MHPTDEPFRVREIWPPGTLIKGDYAIQNKIGGGGFGTVYLARHRFLGTTHVIKRLHEQFASDPEYVNKFVNEARVVRRLKGCPNVVEVEHMTQSEDGHLILVMEHISGGDLAGLMASRELSVEEVVEYSRQIATGLEAAHASGLVHRDIKPQNVMLSHNSTGKVVLKLIDFGIAADHLSHQQTSVMRGGSIGYAAPEQWMKAGKEIDGRADLYSLGASMYRMLCGRMPYSANDIGDWIEAVKTGLPAAPTELRSGIPKELSDLILEMLAYQPEGRPPDAASVGRRLDALRGGETFVVPAQVLERQQSQPNRRPNWLGIGLAAVAVSATAGWLAISTTRENRPPVLVAKPDSVNSPATKAARQTDPPRETSQKPEPAIDHAAIGDAALNSGDYPVALLHFRSLGDPKRLEKLQRAAEVDADERSSSLLDKGEFAEPLRIVDGWLREFPQSQRLQNLRSRILRAKDVQ